MNRLSAVNQLPLLLVNINFIRAIIKKGKLFLIHKKNWN